MGWLGGDEADADGALRHAGRYLLGRVLGVGAMGVVRASFDPVLQREIAVKVLGPRDRASLRDTLDPTRSRLFDTSGAPVPTSAAIDDARLLEEARALASVAHPNIVEVFDVGVCEAGVFIAMELVDGSSLRAWNIDHDPDWRTAIEMLVPAGNALAAAHAVGIVHGDFKPDNVLVATDASNEPRVKVVDFGLARAIGRVDPGERPGVVFGTPAYLAPECWEDPRRQPAADQFSFFVALTEAIVGRRPYPRVDSMSALLIALQEGPRLDALRRLAPPRLHRAIARGLAVDPARRFASMNDALDELRMIVAEDRRSRSRRFVAALTLGTLLPVAAIAAAARIHEKASERASLADCVTEAKAIDETWNDDVRARIAAAVTAAEPRLGADTSTRVLGWLDAYAADWSAGSERSCTAAVSEPTELAVAVARGRCFAERRGALAALVEVLEAADAEAVRNAVTAATELPRIEACEDPAWLARHVASAPAPEIADQVADAERMLARAHQLSGAGRGEEALALVGEAEKIADITGFPRLLVAVRTARGNALNRLGRFDDAAVELEAAYFAARELDDDASAAIAAELASLFAKIVRLDDALAWARHGETALASIGDPEGETRARLELAVSTVHVRRGDFMQALVPAERARDIRVEVFGAEHPATATAEVAVGNVLGQLDRTADAIACFERARGIFERTLGPEHIDLANAYHSLGMASVQLRRFEDARRFEEQALAIRVAWLGDDHPAIATALVGLSYADLGLERHDAAQDGLERALAIREARYGAEHPAVAATLASLAQVASKRGDCHEAVRLLERAVAMGEHVGAGDRRDRLRLDLSLADALVACDDLPAARAHYDAARLVAEGNPLGFAGELERARAGIATVGGANR